MLFLAALAVGISGCADYVPEKATELQARNILSNLSRIQPVPDPNVPIPEPYRQGPRIIRQMIGEAPEWKLFYFAKYHRSDYLRSMINAQFAMRSYDKKGRAHSSPTYTVTSNSATNQLLVRAPTREDIDAVQSLLEQIDVPPVQVKIDCLISELYANVTADKEVTLLIEDLFGEDLVLSGKEENGQLQPAFPGASLRDPARRKFGLKVGYADDLGVTGGEFRALVDTLISRGYLKVLMNPTLEVVNGQSATIVSRDYVPLQEIFIRGTLEGFLQTSTQYRWVIDSLRIRPHVYADGYIGLETAARIGAKLAPEGIAQRPIVTERKITNAENRIRHGESLIIGGIKKTEKRDVVRGVPVLKDIPVVGSLFSGRDMEERAKEIIFILTPTISTGGMPNEEMVDMLRDKHREPAPYETFQKAVMDPFGMDTRERERQRQLLEAEEAMLSAAAEKSKARLNVREAEEQAEKARSDAVEARTALDAAKKELEEARKAAQAAKAEAEKVKAGTEN